MKIKCSFFLFLCLFGINTVYGCLCYTISDFDEQIERSDLIFVGKVDTIFTNYYETNQFVFLIRIKKYYKSKYLSYFTSDAVYIPYTSSCSKAFQQDSTYLIYARDIGYFNTVHMCSRTNLISDSSAKKDLSLLEKTFEAKIPETKITKNILKQIRDKAQVDSTNATLQASLDQLERDNSFLKRNNKISFLVILFMLILMVFFLKFSSKKK